MIATIVILSLFLVATLSALVLTTSMALDRQERLDELVEAVKEARAAIGHAHDSIAVSSKVPLLSDEPVVKRFVSDVVVSKQVLQDVLDALEPTDEEEPIE